MKRLLLPLLLAAALTGQAAYAEDAKPDSGLKIGVIHCCVESDSFMWSIVQNIRKAAKENGAEIEFINAEGNQRAELDALNKLKSKGVNALLMSIVIDDTHEKPFQKELINLLNSSQIPVVFYLLAVEDRFLKTNDHAYRVGSIPAQSGILEGEMATAQWSKHPEWDKNGDGIMQYAILKGPPGNPDAEGRTKWVRATLSSFPTNGVKSQEVAFDIANWDRKAAKDIVSRWIADGTAAKIEVLLSNNDDMMLGARDALLTSDYRPALFGIDALPETIQLIKQGDVAGTVLQNTKAQAANAYKLAANLAAKRNPEQGLDYPLARQELIVPYVAITQENVNDIQ